MFSINLYILINRNDGYKYFPFKTYSELYVTDSSLHLKDIHFVSDSVELHFSKNMQQKNELETWETLADIVNMGFAKANFNTLKIALLKGIKTYTITSIVSKQQLQFIIDHNQDSSSKNYVNEFIYANIPGPQIKVGTLKTWASDKGFSKEEKLAATTILIEKTSYQTDSSDYYNSFAIAKFVSTLCNNKNGIHAYKLSEQRPIGQLQQAMKCNASMACGNYAAIVGYLFSVANIPNRLVCFQGPAGNWQYGVHYYNEIYLREKQQWVLIDAANNISMPFSNNSGKYLNAVDVKKLVQLGATSNISAYRFTKDSTQLLPYDSINQQHIYYNQSNANIALLHANADVTNSPFRNFVEFYTFNRDVDFYSDVNRNDWLKIIVKELAAMLLIILAILFVFNELKYKGRKVK